MARGEIMRKLLVRLDDDVHESLKMLSEQSGVSMNTISQGAIINFIAQSVKSVSIKIKGG